jgi:hypothetical protein
MPRKANGKNAQQASYWQRRIESADFRRALTDAVEAEFRTLSAVPVGRVVDAQEVRRVIAAGATPLIHQKALADLVIQMCGTVVNKLARKEASVLDLLGDDMTARIDAILNEDLVLSKAMEDFIGDMMGQEFVQGLFTDIIYTSIVSFNKKVNPLFGGIAMTVLESQIKGFIRLFLPMARKQAVAFATSPSNQAVLFGFTRAIVRHLLNRPLASFLTTVSARQRKKAEALIRQSIADQRVNALVTELALAVWDELYRTTKDQRVGDLLHLTANVRRLAEHSVEVLLSILARPHLASLAAAELALAAAVPRTVRR